MKTKRWRSPALWISDLRIRYKVLVIVFVGIAGFSAYLVFNYLAVSRTGQLLSAIQNTYFPVLERSEANKARLPRIVETFQSAVSAGETEMVESGQAVAEEMRTALAEIGEIDPSLVSSVVALGKQIDGYVALASKVSTAMIDGGADSDDLDSNVEQMATAFIALASALERFHQEAYGRFTAAVKSAEAAGNEALTVGVAIGLFTIVILVIVGVAVATVMTRSINGVVAPLREMASGGGNLTVRIKNPGSDEIGELVRCFNLFVEKLHDIVANVATSTSQLAISAEQLSAVATETAQSVSRQQLETQTLADTADSMLNMMNTIAFNTSDAAQLANDADEQTVTGRAVVSASNDSIAALTKEVKGGARSVGELTGHAHQATLALAVINELATQTNVLSLNAAIEAANAGEHGAGFAIVAGEVRTLAKRTHENTGQIETIVKSMQGGVKAATESMLSSEEHADHTLSEAQQVHDALEAISGAVSKIKAANHEVDTTVGQYGELSQSAQENIVQIKGATDAAAKAVNQISSASGELATLASRLQSLVGQFTIAQGQH